MNWNTCSSCYGIPGKRRDKLILPCMATDRIYVFDLSVDPLAPKIHKVIEPKELHCLDVCAPHTPHCLADGRVMISTMGDGDENGKGSFILLEESTFNLVGTWQPEPESAPFGYDFWYQPRHNVMVSSQWGAPLAFRKGFKLEDVQKGKYGTSLVVWDWTTHLRIHTLDLGPDGLMPLEVRFLHNPNTAEGYVGCGLGSTVYRFFKSEKNIWEAEKVISIPSKKVSGWIMDTMPGVITDILISLDDRFLYLTCWLFGDVRQYDITDTRRPQLVGKVDTGGCIYRGGAVTVTEDQELDDQPVRLVLKKRPLQGAPQMLQLSLDGERLYATTSLYAAWDTIFYPDMIQKGAMLMQINVNTKTGGLDVNRNCLVDFGAEPEGPVLAHEIRFPGGDSTSDVWI
ncbi:methanethiol oxidase-like [Ornithodoros turicata]|uniref:methanethiol oxidase-like n=1 Tax=Ornithodoros turicata TaxID=34597 RepID=UPI0031397D49